MSNSLETSLTTLALSYFPWGAPPVLFRRTDVRKALCVAALACTVRPTNAVIWTYMIATILWQYRWQTKVYLAVILDVLMIG